MCSINEAIRQQTIEANAMRAADEVEHLRRLNARLESLVEALASDSLTGWLTANGMADLDNQYSTIKANLGDIVYHRRKIVASALALIKGGS